MKELKAIGIMFIVIFIVCAIIFIKKEEQINFINVYGENIQCESDLRLFSKERTCTVRGAEIEITKEQWNEIKLEGFKQTIGLE